MGSAEKAINNTTHQEKYKKYNLKVQKRGKDFTKSNIYNIYYYQIKMVEVQPTNEQKII